MAYVTRVFECAACTRRFEIFQEREELPPTDCPFCSKPEVNPEPVPSTTAIGARTRSKGVDRMYRSVEEHAAHRAEMAGDPSLKITNMKDYAYGGGVKEGDVVAVAPQGDGVVQKVMEQTGHNPWSSGQIHGVPVQNLITDSKAPPTDTGAGTMKKLHTKAYGSRTPPVAVNPGVKGKFG